MNPTGRAHMVRVLAAMSGVLASDIPMAAVRSQPAHDDRDAAAQIRADRARRKAEQFEKQKKGKGLK